MKLNLDSPRITGVTDTLSGANRAFNSLYPGEDSRRQPVHTVYGGAHLFKSDTAGKMGFVAIRPFDQYPPDFVEFAKALSFQGADMLPTERAEIERISDLYKSDPGSLRSNASWLAATVYHRVKEKLELEPVEDFRIDFEDGFGNRPDDEEDKEAVRTAREVTAGMSSNTLPPFIGIRIKPFSEDLSARSIRTLDLFVSTLVGESGARLPDNFVVTLPKVTVPEQVSALVSLFEILEESTGLERGALKLEIMVETPQSIFDADGKSALSGLVRAGQGRCVAAHFGVYDFTASFNITAAYQAMRHPACDFARSMMQASLLGTGIWLSDGATNIMPLGPHRSRGGLPLTEGEHRENRDVVHKGWKLCYDDIRHSLLNGYYQGWDLHPAQFAVRYAAVYSFFLEGLDAASQRLKAFVDKAAQATLVGDVFDDAATGQALLNYFLRAINCGAIEEDEATATGLSLEEIRSRSF